ncbi:hypothetical protein SKAU_G00196060 [Synaphobranchus kaupii]|uniref:Gypsy retrotransposon integrase-like protein 1 n=1 Tax=Synaphobranchus kaupii TaxID=118154 RepID=A0A9Q1IVN6_SYNKA|nr:hypothetical protein SKAU_G00196060 [Synaphobranchus kaupii]
MNFDFGSSPVPPEWKDRITKQLNSMPEVFAQHDLDFGHTENVKHHIKLSDETPFKHRARPIHPQDVDAVRKHLSELLESGYYRRFVQDYSKITKPLNDLTAGYPPLQKGNHKEKKKRSQYFDPRESFGDRWTPSCQQAFNTIIEKLTSAPVLGFANPKLPYVLHTDASTTGLGAALYQEQDGQMRVIAFASRGLTKSEAKYPAHKLEFLALKWAVTSKFSDYLYGTEFTVVTDSNPLTYILTSAKLDAMSYRWLSDLSTYSFKLQYRAGKQNQDADGLSRRHHGELMDDPMSQKERERIKQFTLHHMSEGEGLDIVLPRAVQAICEKHHVHQTGNGLSHPSVTLVESLALHVDVIPSSFQQEDEHGLPVIPHLSEEDLRERQRADSDLKAVIEHLESGEKPPPTLRKELPDVALWLREWDRLELRRGVLYRSRQDQGNMTYQLALPADLRTTVLRSLHDDMGHLGRERTLDLARSRVYWPKMSKDVEEKIKTCERCVRRKTPPEKAAPLVNITTSRPLELVCMDFLSLEPDRSNTKDILVITDHFTKYAVAIPTRNQKAQTVARNVRIRGKHKLADKWEQDVHVVVQRAGDLPVYTVRPETKEGPLRTLHRDLLLPCGFLPVTKEPEPVKPKVVNRPRTRQNPGGETPEEAESDSDYEDDFPHYWYTDPSGWKTTRGTAVREHSMPRVPLNVTETLKVIDLPVDAPATPIADNAPEEDNYSEPEPAKDNLPEPERENLPAPEPIKEPEIELERENPSETESARKELPLPVVESEKETAVETTPEPECLPEGELVEPAPNIRDETLPVCSDVSECEDEPTGVNEMIAAKDTEDREAEHDPLSETTDIPRRSLRVCAPPERLQYAQLGNPLTLVIQSLLQGLYYYTE